MFYELWSRVCLIIPTHIITYIFCFNYRWLLLSTLPVLMGTLLLLVISNVINLGTITHAVISTGSVIVYFCTFVMGFGPIPNILCSEIFPTRVRGICIAICALTFWIGDIIVTYSLPVMLNSIGLAGVFSIYAVVCTVALVFVFLKVPETKGMPLEVITEFFAVGAKQNEAASVKNWHLSDVQHFRMFFFFFWAIWVYVIVYYCLATFFRYIYFFFLSSWYKTYIKILIVWFVGSVYVSLFC